MLAGALRQSGAGQLELVDGQRLLKILHKTKDGYLLESVNRSYPPRVVQPDEVKAIYKVRYARF